MRRTFRDLSRDLGREPSRSLSRTFAISDANHSRSLSQTTFAISDAISDAKLRDLRSSRTFAISDANHSRSLSQTTFAISDAISDHHDPSRAHSRSRIITILRALSSFAVSDLTILCELIIRHSLSDLAILRELSISSFASRISTILSHKLFANSSRTASRSLSRERLCDLSLANGFAISLSRTAPRSLSRKRRRDLSLANRRDLSLANGFAISLANRRDLSLANGFAISLSRMASRAVRDLSRERLHDLSRERLHDLSRERIRDLSLARSDPHDPSVSDQHNPSRAPHSRSRISRSFASIHGLGSHDPSRAFAVSDLTILREHSQSRISRIRSRCQGSLGSDRAVRDLSDPIALSAFVFLLRDAVPGSQLVYPCQFVVYRPAWRLSSSSTPPRQGQGEGGGGARGVEELTGGEAEAGSPPITAQMPSNERCQVRIALAPSRTVASTLVSCRQAGARPATPRGAA